MAERPDSRPTLGSINVPTLVVVGEEDTLTPPADAELMRTGIPRSRLQVVPKAGHCAPFENPEASAEIVGEFLDHLTDIRD